MDFNKLGLSSVVLDAINELGYTQPTPIQALSIPSILEGQDVLGSAQTGTGKTAAFILPTIDILSSGRSRARMPRAIVLVPTRELAIQVGDNFKEYAKYSKLSAVFLIGGASMGDQERQLNRGADVLIATPGRLLDFIGRGKILLSDVRILIIDEADRMLDMGFVPDVDRIVSHLPEKRQTILFSATMAPAVRKLASKYLFSPKEVSVSPPSTTASTVTQRWIRVDSKNKKTILEKLLKLQTPLKAVVFCNRKREIQTLVTFLNRYGLTAQAMHGDMTQGKRNEVLDFFKNKGLQVLVASNVAARGLDIDNVSMVVNYDIPQDAEDYVHRIGRTGRAGRSGLAVSLALPSDADFIKEIIKITKQKIQPVELADLYAEMGKELSHLPSEVQELPESSFTPLRTKDVSKKNSNFLPGESLDPLPKKKASLLSKKAKTPVSVEPKKASRPPSRKEKAPLLESPEEVSPLLQQEKTLISASPEEEGRPTLQRKSPKEKEPKMVKGSQGLDNFKNRTPRTPRSYHLDSADDKDSVIGFGDHLPAFLTRPVPMTTSKRPQRP
jgi:superfamily II DNA/RNA helicase